MKKLLYLLLVCCLGFGLFLAGGCSSDDEDNSNPLVTGDPNSPSFEIYDNTISEIPQTVAQISLQGALGLIEHQWGAKKSPSGNPIGLDVAAPVFDSVAWSYSNGWNVFYFEISEFSSEPQQGGGTFEDSLWISGWDSIQLFEDGQVVAVPSDTTDSLHSALHVTVHGTNSDGEQWDLSGFHQITISNEGTDLTYGDLIGATMIALDTTTALLVDPDQNSCDLSLITTTTLSNIIIPSDLIEDGCPTSGMFGATQVADLSCGGGTATDSTAFNGTWHFSETFVNGVAHQTLTFGNVVWTHTDTCGVALTTK